MRPQTITRTSCGSPRVLAALFLASFTLGCAASVPTELKDARAAYRGAAQGPAASATPAQLHTAEQALKLAERTFENEGGSDRTRDRAYVATRKAQLADIQARIKQNDEKLMSMQKQAETAQVTELRDAKGALQASEAGRKDAEQGRKDAEAQAALSALELSRLASVKQDERGTVITLSGSVLFASGKSELLPSAQKRLNEVAHALNESNREATMVVEGHTDSKGTESFNLELSTRRAEAVRNYLVSQGIDGNKVKAAGLGFSRPVAENKTAEGRANNRRVEIVVQPRPGT